MAQQLLSDLPAPRQNEEPISLCPKVTSAHYCPFSDQPGKEIGACFSVNNRELNKFLTLQPSYYIS